MADWLIRIDAPSITLDVSTKTLQIEARRRPSIKNGDTLVFVDSIEGNFLAKFASVKEVLGRTSEPINGVLPDEVSARRSSSVPVQATTAGASSREFLKYRYALDTVLESFSKDGTLNIETLKYSLTFVRNLRQPARHFWRGYRRLPAVDRKTIESGEVFIARTGYHDLLFALPVQLQTAFEVEEMYRAVEKQFDKSYLGRLTRLQTFLETRIFAAGDLIKGIDEALDNLGLNENYSHVLATEGDANSYDGATSLNAQSDRFDRLGQAIGRKFEMNKEETNISKRPQPDVDILSAALRELRAGNFSEIERRFEANFRNSR